MEFNTSTGDPTIIHHASAVILSLACNKKKKKFYIEFPQIVPGFGGNDGTFQLRRSNKTTRRFAGGRPEFFARQKLNFVPGDRKLMLRALPISLQLRLGGNSI